MMRRDEDLTAEILKLLKNNLIQPVKDLTNKPGIKRTFLADYLKALENQGYIKSKRSGHTKVYFSINPKV